MNKEKKLTVELDGFSAATDVAEVGDANLCAVGHLADERAAGDRLTTVLYVDLVIAYKSTRTVSIKPGFHYPS